jgi:hypothetical protein
MMGLAKTAFLVYQCPFTAGASKYVSDVILRSIITCPSCGQQQEESMPTDACQFFYECTGCKTLLRPKAGDCCVFCSYGTVACPPIQAQRECCSRQEIS